MTLEKEHQRAKRLLIAWFVVLFFSRSVSRKNESRQGKEKPAEQQNNISRLIRDVTDARRLRRNESNARIIGAQDRSVAGTDRCIV